MCKQRRPLILLLWPMFLKVFCKWRFCAQTQKRASERSTSERQIAYKMCEKTIENSKKIGSRMRRCQRAKNEAKIERKATQLRRKIALGTPAAPPGTLREAGSSALIAINIKVGASKQGGALPGRFAAQFRRPRPRTPRSRFK